MKRGQSGQSTVEYILLLVVVFSLSMAIYKQAGFKNLVGDNSIFFQKMRDYIEFTYCYGGSIKRTNSNYTSSHDTYFTPSEGSHFFSPLSLYPEGGN